MISFVNMTSQKTSLLNGRVTLMQSMNGLRASTDSVLLAAAVQAKSGDKILDMGCGTGAVGLCVIERLKDLNLELTGIDIQSDMIELAKVNSTGYQATYICGDVTDKKVFLSESFDHVVMNPPYYVEGTRQPSPDDAREMAYTGDLSAWVTSAVHWVRQGGTLTLIHRADVLDDILKLMDRRFGAIEIWPIYSKHSDPAIRVIVRGVRNRKTPLSIRPPIILFDEQGDPSMQSNQLLRDGVGLEILK
jgi:tRNA1(Val) A37 N6-methylase TrmN6